MLKTAASLKIAMKTVKAREGQTAGGGESPHKGRTEKLPTSSLPAPSAGKAFLPPPTAPTPAKPAQPAQQVVTAGLFDPEPAAMAPQSGMTAALKAVPTVLSVGLPIASAVTSHIREQKAQDQLHNLRRQAYLQQIAANQGRLMEPPKAAGLVQKAKRNAAGFVEGAAQQVADDLNEMHRPQLLPTPLSQLPDRHPQQT